MYGDIIYVDRKPLLWHSTDIRKNPNSKKVDSFIFRTAYYRHYGIDVGSGMVIHFQGDSFWLRQGSCVIESSLEDFLKDGQLVIVRPNEMTYDREDIVLRAKGMIGSNFGGYSITMNNCEHFAMWCATGKRVSKQMSIIAKGTSMKRYLVDMLFANV